jgi:hypothetical protein
MHNTEKGKVKIKNMTDMGNMTNVEDRTSFKRKAIKEYRTTIEDRTEIRKQNGHMEDKTDGHRR